MFYVKRLSLRASGICLPFGANLRSLSQLAPVSNRLPGLPRNETLFLAHYFADVNTLLRFQCFGVLVSMGIGNSTTDAAAARAKSYETVCNCAATCSVLPVVPQCAAADVCCFRARHSSANENLDFAQDLVVVVVDVVSVLLRLRCATPLIDQCRDSLWLEFEL